MTLKELLSDFAAAVTNRNSQDDIDAAVIALADRLEPPTPATPEAPQ